MIKKTPYISYADEITTNQPLLWQEYINKGLPQLMQDELDSAPEVSEGVIAGVFPGTKQTPLDLFETILRDYSCFVLDLYETAKEHDPSVGQDYDREVRLVNTSTFINSPFD